MGGYCGGMSHVDGLNADECSQVFASVRRLFERLNASDGNPNVYDFEVSQDTGLPVDTVRRCLEHIDGQAVTLELYGSDYRVTALLSE